MLDSNPSSSDAHKSDPLIEQPTVLGTDSTLRDLPLHAASLDIDRTGAEAASLFNQFSELPGVLLTSQETLIGMLSRSRFLEYLMRPKGCDLFLSEPLSVLYAYARLPPLVLTAETSILAAARIALRRSLELQGEPVLVKTAGGDRLLNAHDLNKAHWQIRGVETQVRYERTQAAMLQTQKMASLGRLVDGVAHEILDPLGFIWGNLTHVSRYCEQLLDLVAVYEQMTPQLRQSRMVAEIKDDIELDYVKEDLPEAIASIQSGAERLKQLATSLQNFCHIDEVYPKPADIHSLIDSIVLLLKSRLTTRIKVIRDYTSLPPITCFAGQLSQVFMNILTRCVDALLSQAAQQHIAADLELTGPEEFIAASATTPQIHITTRLCPDAESSNAPMERSILISIAHNGPGFSAAALENILHSFSVQQRLERETDLAVSYRIITAKHGGKFAIRSPLDANRASAHAIGVAFEIQLPLYDLSAQTPD